MCTGQPSAKLSWPGMKSKLYGRSWVKGGKRGALGYAICAAGHHECKIYGKSLDERAESGRPGHNIRAVGRQIWCTSERGRVFLQQHVAVVPGFDDGQQGLY